MWHLGFSYGKKAGTKPTRLVLHQLGSDGAMVELPVSTDLPLPRLNTKSWDFKDFGFIIIWSFAGNIGKLHKKWFLAGRYARKDLSDVSAKLQIHICESTNAYCSQRCSLQWHLVHLCAWSAFFTWTLNLAACSHATRKVLFRIMWKLAICGYFWHLLKDTVLMLHDVWWLLVVSHILTLQTCGSPTWRTFFPSTLSKKLDSWPHNHGQMQVFLKILRRLTCRHFSYTSTQETWNPLVSDLEDIDFHQFNLRVGPFFWGKEDHAYALCFPNDVSLYTNGRFAVSKILFEVWKSIFSVAHVKIIPIWKGFYHKVQFPTSEFSRRCQQNSISKLQIFQGEQDMIQGICPWKTVNKLDTYNPRYSFKSFLNEQLWDSKPVLFTNGPFL